MKHTYPNTNTQTPAAKLLANRNSRHALARTIACAALLALPLAFNGKAQAATLTWDIGHSPSDSAITDGSGDWHDISEGGTLGAATNWTSDGGVSNTDFGTDGGGSNDKAIFGTAPTGDAGTVTLQSTVRTFSGGITFNDAYTIDTNGFQLGGQGGSNIIVSSGAGAVTISGTGTYNTFTASTSIVTESGGDSLTISSQITGAGGIARNGGGSGGYLVLSNDTNSFADGLTMNNGNGGIAVTSVADSNVNSAAGAGTFIGIGNNATFQFRGASGETDRELRLTGNGSSQIDIQGGGDLLFDGNVVNSKTGGHVLDLIGDTGSSIEIQGVLADNGSPLDVQARLQVNAILSGVNTFTGDITVNNTAVMTIGGNGQLGSGNYAGTIDLNQNGDFIYDSSADQILSGSIIGESTVNVLNHSGTGTLRLTGNTDVDGTWRITGGGTLLINGDSSASTGDIFANVGTLGGTGDHGGTADVRFSGKFAPGDGGIGSITFDQLIYNNNVTADGSFLFDLANPGSSDLVTVNTFELGATAPDFDLDSFVFSDLSAPGFRIGVGDYTLIDYASIVNAGLGPDVFTDSLFGYAEATLIDTGSAIILSVTAVPEPSSTALLGLGGLILALRRRRADS